MTLNRFKNKSDVKLVVLFHFLAQRKQTVSSLQRLPCEFVVGSRCWSARITENDKYLAYLLGKMHSRFNVESGGT